jgi:CDP-diacylglycerol--serine O-phosphatidyltransferase
MNRLKITPSFIPNLFTSMNMFCGFLSIINASNGNFRYAAWLIIIAAIFDALDGAVARLTNSSSKLGVELDSLSDVVSFGAAPSFLIYSTSLNTFDTPGIIISSLLMLAGGFRLARFNVQLVGFTKNYFTGLPIPSSAITIAAYVLAFNNESGFQEPYKSLIIPLVLLLSYLMVSKIKYDTLPKISLKGLKEKPVHTFIIIVAIIFLIFTSYEGLFYIFVFNILFGIFRQVYRWISKKK